jgi:CDP-diacylglycerol--glycerol-3-phosphate 3-phosphatidyltransferase
LVEPKTKSNPLRNLGAANIVTLARILAIPLFLVALMSSWPTLFADSGPLFALRPWIAAAVFTLVSATDAVDGYLARKRNQVTTFGTFIDPLADKLLVTAALLALVQMNALPAWIALVIIAREFVVSGLRMIASAEGMIIAASRLGKAKTTFQDIAIVLFIVKDSTNIFGSLTPWIADGFASLAWFIMSIAVILTLWSMVDYFRKSTEILRGPWN